MENRNRKWMIWCTPIAENQHIDYGNEEGYNGSIIHFQRDLDKPMMDMDSHGWA